MCEHLDILEPCPFCGGEAELVTEAPEYFVHCFNCNWAYPTEEGAIEYWNTRYERTCHNAMDPDESLFKCSECGLMFHPIDNDSPILWYGSNNYLRVPNYCPGCGAKVEQK